MARHHLILAGGGHTHALVLRLWAMDPRQRPSATSITLVNRHSTALYSGLVPAVVAGLEEPDACAIDLRRLCLGAGVSFVAAEIIGLDPARRELRLRGRPPLRYERLSLDVGAVTASSDGAMAVKPLEPFLAWCDALPAGASVRIRGGGAAAVEVALALRGRGMAPHLLLRGGELHLGSRAANRSGERLLAAAGIPVRRHADPSAPADLACTGSRAPAWLAAGGLPVEEGSGRVLTDRCLEVRGHPGLFAAGDCALIASEPRPPSGVWAVRAAPTLAGNLRSSLERPGQRLRPWHPQRFALQLLGDGAWRRGAAPSGGPGVDIAGVCSTLRGGASPSAAAAGTVNGPPAPAGAIGLHWAAPSRADTRPRALAFYGPFAIGPSAWIWRWKRWIDHRFMDRFRDLQPMGAGMGTPGPMACRGCAAKLAAAPLRAALSRLETTGGTTGAPGPPAVVSAVGREPGQGPGTALDTAVDAPVVGRGADGGWLLQSVDGFPALVDDPWLNARLTTVHACTDLWASGAAVESAQALVTLPVAAPGLQEELLVQTLAGVRSVLDPVGARLVGGHTMEGRDGAGLALALTVNGRVPADRAQGPWSKGPLLPGDVLILSRPIGSGVLFAAAMAGAARPEWIDRALETMQQSQAPLVDLLAAHGCHACTDVTGFGLLGHLGEMLGPPPGDGGVSVELDGAAIPAFPGVIELLEKGHASTLAPSNSTALALLGDGVNLVVGPIGPAAAHGPGTGIIPASTPTGTGAGRDQGPCRRTVQGLLIDPQTCGPLLAGVPAERAAEALLAMRRAGFAAAAVIGVVG